MIPTVVYSSETWSLSAQDGRKIEVFEMICLRKICGIRRVDSEKHINKRKERV